MPQLHSDTDHAAARGRRPARAVKSLAALAGLFLAAGCYDQVLDPDFETVGHLTIVNDEGLLDQRVAYLERIIGIIGGGPSTVGGPAGAPPALAPSSIDLTLVAEIAPPTVGGDVLQATAVWMTRDDRAIVSYNVRGSTALGGLDHFVRLLSRRPRLSSSVSFADSDANSVFVDGRYAYAATATSDLSFSAPAVLERIRVRNNRFRNDPGNMRVQLSSFAGTGASSTANEIYVTSGDGGDLYAFDADDMSLLGQFPLDDARWVAWDEPNARVVALQGTPGRLAVFQEGSFPGGSMTLLGTYPFPGADVPESKSTVEVLGGKAFVAAGPEGVQVVCLDNGQVVGSVPRPDPGSLGLDPSVVVTNAVTVQDDLMFISNGEAGVYAAAGAESFETSPCDAPQSITVLGRLQFDNLQSVNHVQYRDGFLFIAAGLGGTKVVDVDVNP